MEYRVEQEAERIAVVRGHGVDEFNLADLDAFEERLARAEYRSSCVRGRPARKSPSPPAHLQRQADRRSAPRREPVDADGRADAARSTHGDWPADRKARHHSGYQRLQNEILPPRSEALFVTRRETRIARATTGTTLLEMRALAGLTGRPFEPASRLQSLRHSFSTNTLIQHVRGGGDADQTMPIQ